MEDDKDDEESELQSDQQIEPCVTSENISTSVPVVPGNTPAKPIAVGRPKKQDIQMPASYKDYVMEVNR